MVSKRFAVLRRHAVLFATVFLLLGGVAYAVTVEATTTRARSHTFYACVGSSNHE